jgi:hypothetical protein
MTKWSAQQSGSLSHLLGPLVLGFIASCFCSALSAEPFRLAEFDEKVLPMVERYGIGCHDTDTAKGDFDLEPFLTPGAVLANRKPKAKVLKQLKARAMPPDGKEQTADAERETSPPKRRTCSPDSPPSPPPPTSPPAKALSPAPTSTNATAAPNTTSTTTTATSQLRVACRRRE